MQFFWGGYAVFWGGYAFFGAVMQFLAVGLLLPYKLCIFCCWTTFTLEIMFLSTTEPCLPCMLMREGPTLSMCRHSNEGNYLSEHVQSLNWACVDITMRGNTLTKTELKLTNLTPTL